MPVELIHAVKRQNVDKLLHKFHGEEVARAVQHGAAILEARLRLDRGPRQPNCVALFVCNALAQSLDAIEHTALRCALNLYSLLSHRDAVGVGVLAFEAQRQAHGRRFFLFNFGRESEILLCEKCVAPHLGVLGRIRYCLPFDEERRLAASIEYDALRARNGLVVYFCRGADAQCGGCKEKNRAFHLSDFLMCYSNVVQYL